MGSGYLLLIAAIWLVVLAPLLLRSRKQVRHTTEALSNTRVVIAGGEPVMAPPRKLRPSAGLYTASDDEQLELVEAEPEYVLLDDADTGTTPVIDGEVVAEEAPQATAAEADVAGEDAPLTGEIVAVAEAEGNAAGTPVDANTDTDATLGAVRVDAAASEGNAVALSVVVGEAELDEEAPAASAQAASATASPISKDAPYQDETPERPDARLAAYRNVDAAYIRGGDLYPSERLSDDVSAWQKPSMELDLYASASDELSPDDIAYLEARRGRGVFDPIASAKLVAARQRRRQQVLAVLCGLTVLALGLALWLGGWVWVAPIVLGAFTTLYLVVLRRQAVEEAKLRHRRMQRMRRARLGVRNVEDDSLGVPHRLQRFGATIVERDEAVADFVHLDYADSSEFFTPDVPDYPGSADPAQRRPMRAV